MKLHERQLQEPVDLGLCGAAVLTVLLSLALLVGACTGRGAGESVDDVDGGATAVPEQSAVSVDDVTAVPEQSAVSVDDVTAVPEPATPAAQLVAVTDQDRIDVALRQLEADVAAGEIPLVFAYDMVDARVTESGDVEFTICAWSGTRVFEEVRESLYFTTVGDDGGISVRHGGSPGTGRDCVNSRLVNSALEHINAYDQFLIEAGANPEIFATDPRRELFEEDFGAINAMRFEGLVDDGLNILETRPTGDISETSQAEVLWRQLNEGGLEILEIAVCRNMEAGFGFYRDGALVDDERSGPEAGPHSIDLFQLVPGDGDGSWRSVGQQSLVWGNCFGGVSWLDSVNKWQPASTSFVTVDP